MTAYEFEEFAKKAKEKFGDKVLCGKISLSEETLAHVNKEFESNITSEDVEKYPEHVWLISKECPNCGADLLGLFGSFQWGMVHGIGNCSECNAVEFQLYHYLKDGTRPIELLAVTGF